MRLHHIATGRNKCRHRDFVHSAKQQGHCNAPNSLVVVNMDSRNIFRVATAKPNEQQTFILFGKPERMNVIPLFAGLDSGYVLSNDCATRGAEDFDRSSQAVVHCNQLTDNAEISLNKRLQRTAHANNKWFGKNRLRGIHQGFRSLCGADWLGQLPDWLECLNTLFPRINNAFLQWFRVKNSPVALHTSHSIYKLYNCRLRKVRNTCP